MAYMGRGGISPTIQYDYLYLGNKGIMYVIRGKVIYRNLVIN